MPLHAFPPTQNLQPFIHSITSLHTEDSDMATPVPCFPTGGVSLDFVLGPQIEFNSPEIPQVILPKSYLTGQVTGSYELTLPPGSIHFKVIFYPTAFAKLTGMEVADITNGFISLSHLSGEWKQLEEVIHNQSTDEGRVKEINSFFLKKLYITPQKWDTLYDQTLDWVANCYTFSMQKLQEDLQYADRHIRRVFKQAVGISPKPYHQIIRFHRSAKLLRENPERPLQDIVAICNYSDVAHLSRQFQAHSGLSLSEFRKLPVGPNDQWMIWFKK